MEGRLAKCLEVDVRVLAAPLLALRGGVSFFGAAAAVAELLVSRLTWWIMLDWITGG